MSSAQQMAKREVDNAKLEDLASQMKSLQKEIDILQIEHNNISKIVEKENIVIGLCNRIRAHLITEVMNKMSLGVSSNWKSEHEIYTWEINDFDLSKKFALDKSITYEQHYDASKMVGNICIPNTETNMYARSLNSYCPRGCTSYNFSCRDTKCGKCDWYLRWNHEYTFSITYKPTETVNISTVPYPEDTKKSCETPPPPPPYEYIENEK